MIKYYDYNASTPIDEEVLEFMVGVYKTQFGNADSRTHSHGNNAREIVETARGNVAALLGCEKNEVIFTSGATESSNTAIFGLKEWGIDKGKTHIITSAIEHKATLESVKRLEKAGFRIDYIFPDKSGRINLEEVISTITEHTLLVTLQHVNNETGIIQPLEKIGAFCKKKNVLFHIDAAQSAGKLVREVQGLDYDMMSISAHKMYGPQGVGALILRKKDYKKPPISALLSGGGQEGGMRSGTLPVALIAGFGKACEIALHNYEVWNKHCITVKDEIISALLKSGLKYTINGDQNCCIANTLNVSFIGVNSEALMIAMREYCSLANGSACNAKDYSHSYVLKAMGLSSEIVESAIRLSWGKDSDASPIDKIIQTAKLMA